MLCALSTLLSVLSALGSHSMRQTPLAFPGEVELDRALDIVELDHCARRRGRPGDGVHQWVAEECFPGFPLSTSTSTRACPEG
jgi:hypothetical protein